ncbi:MAG: tRNA pseudouridine(55) synthase TruB [candidate division WOR-3 bacterium]|nr:MAG: tRNA pseudouridine(55) synthase TruB [candidate division WOR-3 bacterium]
MRGVLNVNKPAGISSYDVIRRVKKRLTQRHRIGHAGTLDPIASGVLLLLFNEATRVSRYLLGSDKEYLAELLFGVRTDTDDITGRTIEEKDASGLDRSAVAGLLSGLTGDIEQVPPRFSALKQNGTPLYRLARRGVAVEPRPRRVTIRSLELVEWRPPRAGIRASVSSGTYVRALARDIGEAAGTGATLSSLVRTRAGMFDLSSSTSLDRITESNLEELLVPVDKATTLPQVVVPEATARRLLNGQQVSSTEGCQPGTLLASSGPGRYLAVVVCRHSMLKQQRLVYADM